MEYTADETSVNLNNASYSFICAILVAINTLAVSLSTDISYRTMFNVFFLVFYILMGLFYIQYPKQFLTASNILFEESEEKDDINNADSDKQWETIRAQFIHDKGYTQKGPTIEQMAQRYGIKKKDLSTRINEVKGVNFNTYINSMRIDYAKELLIQNPTMSLYDIADTVGYSELSNFSRQFKLTTGETASEWRKKHLQK